MDPVNYTANRIGLVGQNNCIEFGFTLTKTENTKMYQAISSIEKSKEILVGLFPKIKSLDYDVREDLTAELTES